MRALALCSTRPILSARGADMPDPTTACQNPRRSRAGARAVVAMGLLSWLVLAAPTLARASDDRDLSDFEHTRWSAREGFPGQVTAMAQTADGFLWLATGQSLYRFDGLSLEHYRPADGNVFPRVSALAAHPDGSLWVGLRQGGLVRVSAGQTRSFGPGQGVPPGIPYALAVDATGAVLAAVDGQLVSGDERGWRRAALEGNSANPGIRSVFVDQTGGAWAGGARLWHRPPGQTRFSLSSVDTRGILAIAQAPDGRIWAADAASPHVRPITNGSAAPALNQGLQHLASTMAFGTDGGLWLGTPGEGVLFAATPDHAPESRMRRFSGAQGLSGDVVGSALRDREGTLWFGTNAGLDRFRQADLVRAGFPSGAYNFALAIDGDGAVWAGSSNRPAKRLRNRSLATSAVPSPVTVAHAGRDGRVWLAGPHGIWRSDGEHVERLLDLPDGVPAQANVRALVEDGAGDLWASINFRGLFRWHNGAWERQPAHGPLPHHGEPVRAVVDSSGSPWFGYRDNLLVNVGPEGTRSWGVADGLSVGHVTAILFTDSHRWIGGSLGLSLFDGETFIPVSFANDFRVSGLHGLVETVTGELWLHGNEGVIRIDAEQMARFLNDPSYRVQPRTLRPLDHLADDSRQLRPLPTAVTDTEGMVWLATSDGVRRVDPRRVVDGEAPPPAQVVSIRGDDHPAVPAHNAILPPLTRRVVVSYTAPGLKYPEILRFRYRLAGEEQTWHESGAAREASYQGLRPGQYRFEVASAYGDGRWTEPTTTMFSIRPALHQTRGFIAACIVAGLLALWLAYQYRMGRLAADVRARIEERHSERERIARELHDTLLQSVQGLILRFQAASDILPPDAPARRHLEAALEQADQVMTEGRDRVTGLRLHEPQDGELLPALAAIGHELADEHGVDFRTMTQGTMGPLDPQVRAELFRIGREALINAFRHAEATAVELEINGDRQGLQLRVRDDGIGIPATILRRQARRGHWGLAGMRERADRIGAKFELWSRENSGTEIEIRLRWAANDSLHAPLSRWRRWMKAGR